MHVIELDNVTFSYGNDSAAAPVLSGASMHVDAGESVAIIGDNGCGKSTIAKLIDAFLVPDSGHVNVLGLDTAQVAGTDGVFQLRQQVGFVFQNPNDQLSASLVIDEVAFGPENLGLSRAAIMDRVEHALSLVGMLDLMGRNVNALSGGQKLRVAIASALAMEPRIMIFDESSSMLDADGRRELMHITEALRDDGVAVLMITHDAEALDFADRVLLIRDGKVRQISVNEAREDENRPFARLMEGIGGKGASKQIREYEGALPHCDPAVKFDDVSFAYESTDFGFSGMAALGGSPSLGAAAKPVLRHVDLCVREGETLAITGANGSGKSTLVQHMNGLLRPTSGDVRVLGISTSDKAGAAHARRNVGVSFQYPERALFGQTVYEDIAFGPKNLGLAKDEIDSRVREAMGAVALPFDAFAERIPFDLSGGEQRKVAIAGVLALKPKVLVLDEPCANLDAPSHANLIGLMLELKRQGQTIAIVTHDERDIALLADRVFELNR